jgi:hypothetical protein
METGVTLSARLPNRSTYTSVSAARTTERIHHACQSARLPNCTSVSPWWRKNSQPPILATLTSSPQTKLPQRLSLLSGPICSMLWLHLEHFRILSLLKLIGTHKCLSCASPHLVPSVQKCGVGRSGIGSIRTDVGNFRYLRNNQVSYCTIYFCEMIKAFVE